MMRTSITTAFILFLATCASCGPDGGGSTSTGSGIPRSTTFAMLSSAQAGAECDYLNGKQGGYGRSVTCSDGSTETTDDSKASCVADAPAVGAACPTFTVGDAEDCASAVGANLCSVTTQSACAAFRACLASVGG